MRKIKFRAWDVERKEMFFPSSVAWKDGTMWAANVFGENRHETVIEKSDLMQFTGLKDKNGKEIFEGDILKNAQFEDTKAFHILPVEWDEGCCSFTTLKRSNHHFRLSKYAERHYEVIGNIHESPELLNPSPEQ